MDDVLRWLLAGLILCAVVGWCLWRLGARRAARRDAEVTTRIEAAERFEAEQEAEAISMREAAGRQRAAELEHEAAQRRIAVEARAAEERQVAEAEREVLRLAEEARIRVEAARASAEAATRLAEAAARRLEAERQAADAAARERARVERERVERERIEAAAVAAEHERARQALVEAARVAAAEAAERERLAAPVVPALPEDTLVLVADDSKIVRVKTGRLLAQHRYQVAFAVDGADAERQVRENRPHVVITDVDMPEVDGFELTRRLRAEPSTACIPVIMITAADDKLRERAAEAGVDVLLGKPYPEDELVAHIRRVMNQAEPQRRATA